MVGKLLRRLAFVAVAVGMVLGLLRRLGLLGIGECSASCACSTGSTACHCDHKTCLAPAPGA
ncbi:MAG: hypothetical protein DWI58_16325 [Chloroflexi bacterium]|nr:MAG: hypothetical protein DWI58_16325 [Chloroflexota bacterium]